MERPDRERARERCTDYFSRCGRCTVSGYWPDNADVSSHCHLQERAAFRECAARLAPPHSASRGGSDTTGAYIGRPLERPAIHRSSDALAQGPLLCVAGCWVVVWSQPAPRMRARHRCECNSTCPGLLDAHAIAASNSCACAHVLARDMTLSIQGAGASWRDTPYRASSGTPL